MNNAIIKTDFRFPGQKSVYNGKVRDVYNINDEFIIMVTTDRISAFDFILPQGIPYKGQVLNQISVKFLQETADIVPNWMLVSPDPMVTIGRLCTPFKVEMIVRGYLSGHAWREYNAGRRTLCGVKLPDGLKENDKFPHPIITPTTKAEVGHDIDVSRGEIIRWGIVNEDDYKKLEEYSYALFKRGTEIAEKRGLILVDTKYEFGKYNNEIYLIDEVHTPDSSRYFYKEGYEERQAKGEQQKQLSKEFVRQWLIKRGFQGKESQKLPQLPEQFIQSVSKRYIELYELVIGKTFVRYPTTSILERIEQNILKFLNS